MSHWLYLVHRAPWWVWLDLAGAGIVALVLHHATKERLQIQCVLRLLQLPDDGVWLYGLDLVRMSNGRLQRGSIYVLLDMLDEGGYIKSRVEDHTPAHIGIPRRVYAITPKGIKYYEELTRADRISKTAKH